MSEFINKDSNKCKSPYMSPRKSVCRGDYRTSKVEFSNADEQVQLKNEDIRLNYKYRNRVITCLKFLLIIILILIILFSLYLIRNIVSHNVFLIGVAIVVVISIILIWFIYTNV